MKFASKRTSWAPIRTSHVSLMNAGLQDVRCPLAITGQCTHLETLKYLTDRAYGRARPVDRSRRCALAGSSAISEGKVSPNRNSLGFVIHHGGCRLANYMPVGPNGSFGGLRLLADKTKIAYATFTAQTVESHRNAHAECAW